MNSDLHIPDFTLLKKCGRGAFSDVWIAQDLSSRKVALKIIDKTLPFDRELSGLCACRDLHDLPGLIRILHIGETPEFFYYSMELADSLTTDRYTPATLSNILKFNGRIPAEKVTAMAQEMLSTLAVLHRMDIIHRDIKPENIMLVNGKFKLSDIGLMRSLTHTFSLAGTLGFIPPERLGADSGTQSAQDDLYALGKVLYCAWSGNPVEKFPALIPEITTSQADRLLNRIITKACSRNPRNRFADAGEFLAAINGNMPRWKILLSLPGIMALSGIILAAVVILGAALFFYREEPPHPADVSESAVTAPPDELNKFSTPNNAETEPDAGESQENQTPQKTFSGKEILLVRNSLDSDILWQNHINHGIVCSKNTITIAPGAAERLYFRSILPEYYRIVFHINVKDLSGEIRFGIESQLDPKIKVNGTLYCIIETDDGDLSLQGCYLKHFAAKMPRYAAFIPYRDRYLAGPIHRFELQRTPKGIDIKVNGKTKYSGIHFPAGGRFFFHLLCKDPTDCQIYDVEVFKLE